MQYNLNNSCVKDYKCIMLEDLFLDDFFELVFESNGHYNFDILEKYTSKFISNYKNIKIDCKIINDSLIIIIVPEYIKISKSLMFKLQLLLDKMNIYYNDIMSLEEINDIKYNNDTISFTRIKFEYKSEEIVAKFIVL